MPNWTYISISATFKSPEDRISFLENVKGRKNTLDESDLFDFNHFIPQPSNLYKENISHSQMEELKRKGIPNWYTWNTENWGTKWGACDVFIQHDELCHAIIQFNTAWSFPAPVIEKMYEMYPDVKFFIDVEYEGDEEVFALGNKMEYIPKRKVYYDKQGYEIIWNNGPHQWERLDGTPVDDYEECEIVFS